MRLFETGFLLFFIFSFLGWIWESVIYEMIDKHRIVNRGFMFGPYIPIYGTGAMIDLLILGDVDNMVLLFFLSAILCTMVEYVTSFAMEKMFHARWWDYYDMFWHLNGRICLEGALAFGGLSVVLVQWINPAARHLISLLSPTALHIVAWVLFAVFVTDFVISVRQAADFEKKVRRIAEMLVAAKDRMVELYDTVVVETFYKSALSLLTGRQKRLLHAFPALRSVSYPGIIKSIRSVMPGSREKADLVSITERIMRLLKGESAEEVNKEVSTMDDEKNKSTPDSVITLQPPKDEDVSELSRMTDDYTAFLEKLDSGEITDDETSKESEEDQ
ncbi:MAG: putative ABC transporter permease [Lachnospiraceae bacterium]|nr:putative ABC transporter permease [Lachnospiraceae bacterium]